MPPLRHYLARTQRFSYSYTLAPMAANPRMNVPVAVPAVNPAEEILVNPIYPLPAPPVVHEPEQELLEPEDPFTTIAQDTLPQQLDCIVWNHKHDLFTFGSYELAPNTQTRIGTLYMAQLTPDIETGYTIQQEITGLPGILDLKWEPTEEKILAAATSSRIIIYKLEITDGVPTLTQTHTGICGDTALALYVQWLNPTDLVSSDSGGYLRTWTLNPPKETEISVDLNVETEANQLTPLKSTYAHDFFVWFVHYDAKSGIFYSGDDDGVLTTVHESNFEVKSKQWKKKFDSGVTAINTKDALVTVGCYDDKLRVFKRIIDMRDKKIVLSDVLLEMNLGGTVWRTIWIPPFAVRDADEDPNVLKMGVAAGKNGIHMISFNKSTWTWETTLCCLDHIGYLAYGLDMKVNEEDKTYTVATCYFDSHSLQIFKMKP